MVNKNSKKNKKSIGAVDTGAGGLFGFFSSSSNIIPQKKTDYYKNPLAFIHDNIMYLNNSKFFAGVVMILLNVGSKFVTIQFSKSTEDYLKFSLSKQLLIFAMAWMGTRDIYVALALTAIFTVLADHIFNEDSPYCIIPENLRSVLDTNNDGTVTHDELNSAIAVLEKAKKEKLAKEQKR